jgi:hypothetical protein
MQSPTCPEACLCNCVIICSPTKTCDTIFRCIPENFEEPCSDRRHSDNKPDDGPAIKFPKLSTKVQRCAQMTTDGDCLRVMGTFLPDFTSLTDGPRPT